MTVAPRCGLFAGSETAVLHAVTNITNNQPQLRIRFINNSPFVEFPFSGSQLLYSHGQVNYLMQIKRIAAFCKESILAQLTGNGRNHLSRAGFNRFIGHVNHLKPAATINLLRRFNFIV